MESGFESDFEHDFECDFKFDFEKYSESGFQSDCESDSESVLSLVFLGSHFSWISSLISSPAAQPPEMAPRSGFASIWA